jgi:hypothetical protein
MTGADSVHFVLDVREEILVSGPTVRAKPGFVSGARQALGNQCRGERALSLSLPSASRGGQRSGAAPQLDSPQH